MFPIFDTNNLRIKLNKKYQQVQLRRMQALSRALSRYRVKKPPVLEQQDDGMWWRSIEYTPTGVSIGELPDLLYSVLPNQVYIDLIQQDYRQEVLSLLITGNSFTGDILDTSSFVSMFDPDFGYDDDFQKLDYDNVDTVFSFDGPIKVELKERPNGDQYYYTEFNGFPFGGINEPNSFVLLSESLDLHNDKTIENIITYPNFGIHSDSDIYESLVPMLSYHPYDDIQPESQDMLRAFTNDTNLLDIQVSFGDGTDIDFSDYYRLEYSDVFGIGTIQITGKGKYYHLKKVLDEMWKLGLYEKTVNK